MQILKLLTLIHINNSKFSQHVDSTWVLFSTPKLYPHTFRTENIVSSVNTRPSVKNV